MELAESLLLILKIANPESTRHPRRKFFGTLYNTYSFFALYANVDGFDPSAAAFAAAIVESPVPHATSRIF